jgi:formylglycine-generating enzyme required for sulfatase activity
MTRVDGGEFWMGCNDVLDDQCTADELPQHLVTVPPFQMDTLEITNSQYQECVDSGVCEPLHYDNGQCFVIDPVSADWIKKVLPYEPEAKFRGAQFPALCMTWEQARQFCEDWRCPDCRLCTEAEFEVASRGACLLYEGKDCKQAISKFPWGDLEPLAALGKGAAPGNFADETAQAKYPALEAISGYVDGYAETSPVGSYPSGASKYGILDLSGNVWEWTADCWNEGYTGAPADGAAWLDGPCTQRVRRGGSWINGAADLRSSTRSGYNPTLATDLVGVRCCR